MANLSHEAERQEEAEDVQVLQKNKGSRPGAVVSVRLKPEEFELLAALSETHGRTLSETLRVGLHCLAYTRGDLTFHSAPSTRGAWGETVLTR